MTRTTQEPAGGTPPPVPPASDPVLPAPVGSAGDGQAATPAASRCAPGTATIPVRRARGTSSPPGDERPHASSPGGSTWTIELPAGLKLLSLNDRDHWAPRNRTYQSLKKAAWAMTLNARLPRLERATVVLVYDPPDRRHRDADNLAPTLKAVVDGIVASGCIGPGVPARPGQGDDSRYVPAVSMEIGDETFPRGRLRIIIREAVARGARQARRMPPEPPQGAA